MRTKLLIFAALFIVAVVGCKKDEDKEVASKNPTSNAIVSNTACKYNVTKMQYESNQSCVEYDYDEAARKLSLLHIDAGFNCCPGELSCEISYIGDTIILTEAESKQECSCNCLYDLNIVVEGLPKSAYVLKFVEPYAEGMEQLIFPIDLTVQDTGTYCVARENYPWGIYSY